MGPKDKIFVDVVSSNQNTRQQRPVLYRFNGAGEQITDSGEKVAGPGLAGKWPLAGAELPPFEAEQYRTLVANKDKAGAEKLLADYQVSVSKAAKSGAGESEEMVIVDRVMKFLKEQEHISEEDGSHFVLHRKDLQVTRIPLQDGSMLFKITGAAIFGG